MSFGLFEAIENEEAAIEIDRTTALAFVVSKVDERFGDYLRNAQSKKEFDDRWAQVERDVTSVVKESLTPNISTMRKIKGALKPSFDSSAPRAKTAFQKNTWLFSPDLRVYTFEGEKPEFVCPNCSTTKTAMGLSRCSCGTLWNAWSVVEGDKKRFLCREIEDRDTVLGSNRSKKVAGYRWKEVPGSGGAANYEAYDDQGTLAYEIEYTEDGYALVYLPSDPQHASLIGVYDTEEEAKRRVGNSSRRSAKRKESRVGKLSKGEEDADLPGYHTSALKVSREEQEFIEGWNAYPNPRPKMSQAFKEGFEARMFDEEEGS